MLSSSLIMAILTFDSLRDLSEHFDSPVFQDLLDDSLLVQETMSNVWHRYHWSHGHREINFLETISGSDLPILIQAYPRL